MYIASSNNVEMQNPYHSSNTCQLASSDIYH